MFGRWLIIVLVVSLPFTAYGQSCFCSSSWCRDVRSSCPALYPSIVMDDQPLECITYPDEQDSCLQCNDCCAVIKDVPLCSCTLGPGTTTAPQTYQPCTKSIADFPDSKTAKPLYIAIGPDDPIRKNGGQSLFVPLTIAASVAGIPIERSCMEKGRPIVYASSGTDSYQIDAYFDGENIRVDLVSRIPSKPLEERQVLTDQLNQKIAKVLAEKIKGTLIKNW